MCVCAIANPGQAQQAPDGKTEPSTVEGDEAPPSDWHVSGYAGGFASHQAGGMAIGSAFLYRTGVVAGGAMVEAGSSIFDYSYAGAAALAGLSVRPERFYRIEVLGEFGAHHYTGVNRDWLFGDDPGASGGSAYAGARASVAWLFGRKRRHFELGLYGDFQDDLSRHRVNYTYTEHGLFGGDYPNTAGSAVIGMSRVGMGLDFKCTQDLF